MKGLVLNNYEIISPIWASGNKTIYDSIDKRLGFRRAISIYDKHSLIETLNKRLFYGATMPLLNLHHKNINSCIDFILGSDNLAIVNEFFYGISLYDFIKNNKTGNVAAVTQIIIEVLNAFEFAHNKEFVHGSLKPTNIFIQNDGNIKILGFEKRILFGSNNYEDTGARAFVSPEGLLQGESEIDQSTDVYHIGLILYYAITGVMPNLNCGFSSSENFVFNPLPEFDFSKSEAKIESIIKKACQLNKNDRYQSIKHFKNDVEDFLTVM